MWSRNNRKEKKKWMNNSRIFFLYLNLKEYLSKQGINFEFRCESTLYRVYKKETKLLPYFWRKPTIPYWGFFLFHKQKKCFANCVGKKNKNISRTVQCSTDWFIKSSFYTCLILMPKNPPEYYFFCCFHK